MDLGVGRAVEELGEVIPWVIDADSASADLDATVGAGVLGEHVGDRVLANRSLERAWMVAEEPVGHEPAVGEAVDAPAIAVRESFVNGPIRDPDDVAGVLVAPPTRDGARVRLAVAGRAPGVGPEDVKSSVGQRRHFQPRRGPERKIGTTVYSDDQRSLGVFASGAQQPAVDVVSVGVGNVDALDTSVERPEPFAAVCGEPAELAA